MVPPSPTLTSSGSAIAVGTSVDAAVIQSLEKGDFTQPEDDTRSLTESIRQHIVDGGLRYHAYHAGKYCFPNDETEQYRDDLKHNLTVYLCDGEFFHAPIHRQLDDGAEVLDLGELGSLVMVYMLCQILIVTLQVPELGNGASIVRRLTVFFSLPGVSLVRLCFRHGQSRSLRPKFPGLGNADPSTH